MNKMYTLCNNFWYKILKIVFFYIYTFFHFGKIMTVQIWFLFSNVRSMIISINSIFILIFILGEVNLWPRNMRWKANANISRKLLGTSFLPSWDFLVSLFALIFLRVFLGLRKRGYAVFRRISRASSSTKDCSVLD